MKKGGGGNGESHKVVRTVRFRLFSSTFERKEEGGEGGGGLSLPFGKLMNSFPWIETVWQGGKTEDLDRVQTHSVISLTEWNG